MALLLPLSLPQLGAVLAALAALLLLLVRAAGIPRGGRGPGVGLGSRWQQLEEELCSSAMLWGEGVLTAPVGNRLYGQGW